MYVDFFTYRPYPHGHCELRIPQRDFDGEKAHCFWTDGGANGYVCGGRGMLLPCERPGGGVSHRCLLARTALVIQHHWRPSRNQARGACYALLDVRLITCAVSICSLDKRSSGWPACRVSEPHVLHRVHIPVRDGDMTRQCHFDAMSVALSF
jgi:hypothetical protein